MLSAKSPIEIAADAHMFSISQKLAHVIDVGYDVGQCDALTWTCTTVSLIQENIE